jgi:hypothetical protein
LPLTDDLRDGLLGLIETYEAVRNLPRFDPNHCPIMEFQTSHGKDFFLQYHRTRDFDPVKFELTRQPIDGEIEVPFVRGATPPEGITARVAFQYAGAFEGKLQLRDYEEGSWDIHYSHVFPELMVRKRNLQMIYMSSQSNLDFNLLKFVVHHEQRSKLFKPRVSVIHKIEDIITHEDRKRESDEDQYVNVYVVSDGKRAFIKRVD